MNGDNKDSNSKIELNGHFESDITIENRMETDGQTDNDHHDTKEEKKDNDGDYDADYAEAINRREINRPELFGAPDGVLFRFLSEFLSRTKMIADPLSTIINIS